MGLGGVAVGPLDHDGRALRSDQFREGQAAFRPFVQHGSLGEDDLVRSRPHLPRSNSFDFFYGLDRCRVAGIAVHSGSPAAADPGIFFSRLGIQDLDLDLIQWNLKLLCDDLG